MMKTNCRIRYTVKRILLAAIILIAVASCNSTFSQAATFKPRLSAPAEDSPYYSNGVYNPYVTAVGTLRNVPNCTTYAWGRAYELLGTQPPLPRGDAKDWYGAASDKGLTPKLGAIACWNNGGFGHVAVVEKIKGNQLTLSQSSYDPSIYWEKETKDVNNMGAGFQGYIYILGITLISPEEVHLNKNQTYQIEISTTSSGGKVEWTSKDTKVASVSQTGLVKAKGIYMTTITASYAWERVKCRIYVHNPSLKLSKSSLSLKVGETKSLKATVKGVSNEVTWQSSAPTVAIVSGNGVITAVGVGKTTISATANGKTKKCTVKVKDNTPKTISLNESKVEINKGDTFTLIATVTGMSNTVTWLSSNKKIATVKGGVVTGRGKGTATITVKCGKLKAKCKITVKKENTKASRDNEYKKVYRDVILQFEKDKIYPYSLDNYYTYNLIYIDKDRIPELVCTHYYDNEAIGPNDLEVYTYYKEKAKCLFSELVPQHALYYKPKMNSIMHFRNAAISGYFVASVSLQGMKY